MANTFLLRIVSLDGVEYEGNVRSVSCRAIDGDIAILANHTNYVTAVGMGTAKIIDADGAERRAACIGGMLSMVDGQCSLAVTTWEWSDRIDKKRAENARERAERIIETSGLSEKQYMLANAKLKRALVRLGAAQQEKCL